MSIMEAPQNQEITELVESSSVASGLYVRNMINDQELLRVLKNLRAAVMRLEIDGQGTLF